MTLRRTVATVAATLAVLAASATATVTATTYEDGSGRLGPVDGTHVSWCLPGGLCQD